MPIKFDIGEAGGPQYDVARAIKSFLDQMAEKNIILGAAVIKELMQNADDAGATELSVLLDERSIPGGFESDFDRLLQPALLIRNNAPFQYQHEKEDGSKGDFDALCDVASGHKRAQAVSAGRFGIGFNSVYFLTDTPVIFSRREVHIFDPTHRIFGVNGWKFSLDEFPSRASSAGPIKTVLDWMLPKAALNFDRAFGEIASSGDDYQQALLRLPLRLSGEGVQPLRADCFPTPEYRRLLLKDMEEQVARAILFLKSLERVEFGVLTDDGMEIFQHIEITPNPSEFWDFVNNIQEEAQELEIGGYFECGFFKRSISVTQPERTIEKSFYVKHSACFDQKEIVELRERLHRNEERAVPWVSIGIPANSESIEFDGRELPAWRVFLPLLEEGPCCCVFNGAFFVGPSRQTAEFQMHGSDESLRKTQWNKALVEHALVPMMRYASLELTDLIPDLIKGSPQDYLRLFPISAKNRTEPRGISEFLQQVFSNEPWYLKCYDLWNGELALSIGEENAISLEMVPQALVAYQDRFQHLSMESRRFISWSLGEAIRNRLGESSGIEVKREESLDVVQEILGWDEPPKPGDLTDLVQRLARRLGQEPFTKAELVNLWSLKRFGNEEILLYQEETLYVLVGEEGQTEIHQALQALGLGFKDTEWVDASCGLPGLNKVLRQDFDNLVKADDHAALELLKRVQGGDEHDRISQSRLIEPVIDFLCGQDPNRLSGDLKLGFLIKTADNKRPARALGTVFLKPQNPKSDDEAVWEGLLRRTFAEVDPQFMPHIQRLIDHAPNMPDCMHAPDCQVRIARPGHLLEVLHQAVEISENACEKFQAELNRVPRGQTDCRPESYRTARLILEEAIEHWDDLDESQRLTVLALPIHRAADGRLVSLINQEERTSFVDRLGDHEIAETNENAKQPYIDLIRNRFSLQSEDDLHDAPITLPKRRLLRSERGTYAFYRQQLQIDPHGRRIVLLECLRQIGGEGVESRKLLAYIARYYSSELDSLQQEGSEVSKEEAQELQASFETAKIVPCIDDTWQPFAQCVQASSMADALKKQGWRGRYLDLLLSRLAYPESVASHNDDLGKLIRQLGVSLSNLTPSDIPFRAITSEDPEFSLAERANVISKNKHLLPSRELQHAEVIGSLACRTLNGTAVFNKLELIDVPNLALPSSVLRELFPDAADIITLAREWELTEKEVREILGFLGVPVCRHSDIEKRLLSRFADIWPNMNGQDRFDVLKYTGARSGLGEQVGELVNELDVVFVQEGNGRWTIPKGVLAPCWAKTAPPNLLSGQLPKLTEVDANIIKLWDTWCGLGNLEQVTRLVVQQTVAVTVENRTKAWQALVAWIDKVAKGSDRGLVVNVLVDLQWILARKGDETDFRFPYETVNHPGANILAQAFWVVDGTLPRAIVEDLEFQELEGTENTLCEVGRCLTGAARSSRTAIESVYKLVVDLIAQDDDLVEIWQNYANTEPVYRLFREPDQMVPGHALFIGNREYASDYGDVLFCFSDRIEQNDTFFKRIKDLYRKLGVEARPSIAQAVSALSRIEGKSSKLKPLYDQLVEMVASVDAAQLGNDIIDWSNIRVLACSDTFEPLSAVYRHGIINRAQLLSEESRCFLIDDRERSTRQLIRWLENVVPDVIQDLDETSQIKLEDKPLETEAANSASLNMGPWEDWFDQLATGESEVRERAMKLLEFEPPISPFKLMPVDHLSVKYILPDGNEILPSVEWDGPPVLADGDQTVFVLRPGLEKDYLGKESELEDLDRAIAGQVLSLLNGELSKFDAFWEIVKETLERPNVILDRMRRARQEHFFHQYHDQTADPDFSRVFDVYLRTAWNAREKRHQLEQEMFDIIRGKFVQERRNQIRGYGYDEFSIFAELVQNAEDAYLQRWNLGLDAPPQQDITFTYTDGENGKRCLIVEHYGRPFNYWRHGGRKIESYGRDVEGVLKSAGSFKPHGSEYDGGQRPIGRFGLGFKSVYLITDRPRIHSGHWHFEIESGCIPNPLQIPENLPDGATRILLPLIDEAQEEFDKEGNRLITLIPFLSEIKCLKLTNTDRSERILKTKIVTQSDVSNGTWVELVEISGISYVRGGVVRLLRFRSSDGSQQLGIYIAPDYLPASWEDAFDKDTFAVLPLSVHSGCGVGVSHHFELQSGRTHLIDPKGNRPRFQEIADLLTALPQAFKLCQELGGDIQSITNQFWSLWRWDGGDFEAKDLRCALAEVLVRSARAFEIVPTLAPHTCVALDGRPVFLFRDIPFSFAEDLIREAIDIPIANRRISLSSEKVVPEAFGKAYRMVCRTIKKPMEGLREIGWSDIGQTMIDRAWFAEKPELLSAMARCIEGDDVEKIKSWLKLCPLKTQDGTQDIASNLLPSEFPGCQHLPTKKMRSLHKVYDQDAVALLRRVGMPAGPSIQTIETLIAEGLSQSECVGLLHYLYGERRWMRSFFTLQETLQEPWFNSNSGKLTTDEAWKAGFIPAEFAEDTFFRTWLGIQNETDEDLDSSQPVIPDPISLLEEIYAWWDEECDEWINEYEINTYPNGSFPNIQIDFFERDRDQRHGWLTLLLIGCLHTIGKTTPHQHKHFLIMCEKKGWFNTFCTRDAPATEWMKILEDYLGEQVDDSPYMNWVRQFPSIFQLSNWLEGYVHVFEGLDRRSEPFSLRHVITPRSDPGQSGGGADGPPLNRTLGIGACFVVRELRRKGLLKKPISDPHCYVPSKSVRELFAQIGCVDIEGETGVYVSNMIYQFLCEKLDPSRATFQNSFDLPFLTIADNPDLRDRFGLW